MPRVKRHFAGGFVYHVLNRANGRLRIFKKASDFLAFERILAEGAERFDMRVCGYCVMGNHWHLPEEMFLFDKQIKKLEVMPGEHSPATKSK